MPPDAVKEVVPPAQILSLPVILAVKEPPTVITAVEVLLQPDADVPVTVYVIVLPGLAVTLAPVVALKPVPGLHVYVDAPDATKLTLPLVQILADEGVIVTVGIGSTITISVVSFIQPLVLTATVYVVVAAGDTFKLDVVVPVFQLYVPPPEAVRIVLLPLQTESFPVITALGIGFTFTEAVALSLQVPLTTNTL